jgi:uncharacterized membrane protein YqhA
MNWFKRCFLNWRWWIALPVFVAIIPAALVSFAYPFSWRWLNRLGAWVRRTPEQPE